MEVRTFLNEAAADLASARVAANGGPATSVEPAGGFGYSGPVAWALTASDPTDVEAARAILDLFLDKPSRKSALLVFPAGDCDRVQIVGALGDLTDDTVAVVTLPGGRQVTVLTLDLA